MDDKLKVGLRKAILIQASFWTIELLLIAALSLISNSDFSKFLFNLFALGSFVIFLIPFMGLFAFVRTVRGFWKKTAVAFLFLIAIWVINFLAIYLFQLAKWETLADKKAEETKVKQESLMEAQDKITHQEISQKISSLKTENEAEKYLTEILKKAKNHSDESFDLNVDEADSFWGFLLDKQKLLGDKDTAKMCLLLRQDDYANPEDLTSLYGGILWSDTPAAVEAMVEAKKNLLPEFKNSEFYESLYSLGVSVPYDNTDLSEEERVKKAKPIRDRLKVLRNSSNADFIDYLLSGEKFEQWTY